MVQADVSLRTRRGWGGHYGQHGARNPRGDGVDGLKPAVVRCGGVGDHWLCHTP